MGFFEFVSSLLVLLLVVILLMVGAAITLIWLFVRRLRKKNQVSALASTDAPASWALLAASQPAGQHRRLQQIVNEAQAAVAQAGTASFEVSDAAHDIELQAVALDRQVVATSRMVAGAQRAKRLYDLDSQIADLADVTHKLTDLSIRYVTSNASPESTKERLAAIEASLIDLDRAKAAADHELAELNRPLTGGVRAQMQTAGADASQPEPVTPRQQTWPPTGPASGRPGPTPRIRGRY